jgi:hypothetical protein
MRVRFALLSVSVALAGCGSDPPLPSCDSLCPHASVCAPGDGWSCPATGDACQQLKPCPGTTPDCDVVCPDDAECVNGDWTCFGRTDLACAASEACLP